MLALKPSLGFANNLFHETVNLKFEGKYSNPYTLLNDKWACLEFNYNLKKKVPKDEYETTQQYEARVSTYVSKYKRDCSKYENPIRVNVVKPAKLKYDADREKFTFYYNDKESWSNNSVSKIYMNNINRQLVFGNKVKQKKGRVELKYYNSMFRGSDQVKRLNRISISAPVQNARMLKLSEKDLSVNYIGNLYINEELYTSEFSQCSGGVRQHRRDCAAVEFVFEMDAMILSKGKEKIFAAFVK